VSVPQSRFAQTGYKGSFRKADGFGWHNERFLILDGQFSRRPPNTACASGSQSGPEFEPTRFLFEWATPVAELGFNRDHAILWATCECACSACGRARKRRPADRRRGNERPGQLKKFSLRQARDSSEDFSARRAVWNCPTVVQSGLCRVQPAFRLRWTSIETPASMAAVAVQSRREDRVYACPARVVGLEPQW